MVTIDLAVAGQRAGALERSVGASLRPGRTAGGAEFYVALLRGGPVGSVRAGANRGQTLRNDHVAREWRGSYPLGVQRLTPALPAGAAPTERSLPVVVQEAGTDAVLPAVALPLAGCRPTVRVSAGSAASATQRPCAAPARA